MSEIIDSVIGHIDKEIVQAICYWYNTNDESKLRQAFSAILQQPEFTMRHYSFLVGKDYGFYEIGDVIKKTNYNGDVVYSIVCESEDNTTNSKKMVTTLDFMTPGAYRYFLRCMRD